ncbi:MAG: PPE domain-containing protein [Mycobacteriaceae bacterium]|nr:PPE domain-containing protein [Mycobacteriaceae bacterium]
MAQPHEIGFTGRIWDAVPAEKLVNDLENGPGVSSMAEAGLAFARLAAGLGAAAVEFELIRADLGQAWESHHNAESLGRLALLGEWFAEASAASAANAAKAEAQAAAYEIARLAMPSGSEFAALLALKATLLQGHALGGPLTAVSADLEDRTDVAKAAAARVMQEYERATTPLAQPWTQREPPKLTSEAALAAEQAKQEQPPARPAPYAPPVAARPGGNAAFPRVQTAYRAQTIVEAVATETVVQTSSGMTVSVAPATAGPIPPGSMLTGAQSEDEHRVAVGQAGPGAGKAADQLGLDAGHTVAPAVVGGLSATAQTPPRTELPDGAS